jgi:hypothetical protein
MLLLPGRTAVLCAISLSFSSPVLAGPQIQIEQPAGQPLISATHTIAFGSALVGDAKPKTFIIRNTGDADLLIGAVTFSGADATQFALAAAPKTTVPPGGTTFFRVKFSPADTGGKTAALSVASNQTGAESFDIGLGGSGATLSGKRIHVSVAASGANDGTSWANAFTSLQSAITAAAAGDQIWVAAGTYKPSAANREISFRLMDGVQLYGGFAGTETSLSERNLRANPTILSGDLLGNDNSNIHHLEATRSDNSLHVVSTGPTATTSGALSLPTRFDGFIVEGGNANGIAAYGAGLSLEFHTRELSNLTVANAVIRKNTAALDGAGAFNNGHVTIVSCVFDQNRAGNVGSGLSTVDYTAPVIVNTVFSRNLGGPVLYAGDTFARPEVVNCTFTGNQGVIYSAAYATSVFRNCLVWGNGPVPPAFVIDPLIPNPAPRPVVEHCLIEGGFPGAGNFSADPLFANASQPEGADGIWGTDDDGLRPVRGSQAKGAGDPVAVAGLVTEDLRGNARILEAIDVGAYEDRADSDHDGLYDIEETGTGIFISAENTGSDPADPDSDDDGLVDGIEVVLHHSNPNLADSDGDGFKDGFEVSTGFDPASPSSTPDALSTIRTAVEFRFNAADGVSYRIEGSTDLESWTTVENGIIGQGGVVTRFYSTETEPKRYLRVRRN